MDDISLLLLGVLYGDLNTCANEKGKFKLHSGQVTQHFRCVYEPIRDRLSFFLDAPPSFCDMGNAISTLIAQASEGGQVKEEEVVLLSEEHSLILTCCWVSLKVKQAQIYL